MANDDDFILGGRKTKKSSSSQGTPRTQNPRGGSNQSAIKLGAFPNSNMSFTKRLAKDMAIDGAYTGTGELIGAAVGEFIEEKFDVGTNISLTDKDGALNLGLKKTEELGR